MLLRPKLLRFIGTSLLSYIWVAAAISVTPASAADEIDFRNHSSKELITNQTELKNKLPDLQEVLAKNAEAERTIKSLIEQKQPLIIIIGQTDTPSPADNSQIDAGKLRQDLLIEPLIKVIPGKRTYSPSLTFATPSAFGATWGDVFLGASLATQGKTRNQPDASITMGFGLGDAQKLIGLELAYNIGSIKNFGANGTFDLKANRIVYAKNNTQVAAAVGWRTFAQHVDGETIRPSGVFGLVTSYSLLKPKDPVNKMPISFSVGAGGGDFRTGNTSTGVFAGVGVQVHPQIGVGMGWSGVGLNAGASFIPVRTIPLTINAMGADLTDTSRGGTVFVLSVGYGFNFLPK
ncbi:hypothetical protein MEO40_21300 [Dolichospermum sp. ST_sed1]|nr:hypothetical protein [Dolichospermum sp. ST_sed1]MDD1425751.1 hypothetical protein [Dolichospermum sp. ST_sed9]MDD1433589.1 hypothetical protein [Dolichospermum sp. ST_sed6]MDD1457202.1 hypothetical protein [Dolichospermum sp. ST_sed7]MDD1464934.1 hypothetical protein [Dolichospermum sp. ST_sed5]